MEELREAFLSESISKLENLQNALESKDFSPEMHREIFRTLHTIKGTAQTFGLAASAILAHTLENLLASTKNDSLPPEKFKTPLLEGIKVLKKSLSEKNFRLPDSFAENFREFQAETPPESHLNDYLSDLPEAIAAQLSNQEKAALNAALGKGKNLAILEIGFDMATFADEFKTFREKLNARGETIAALPSAKFAALGKIGFQTVFVTFEDITDIIENYQVEVILEIYRTFSGNLPGILHQIIAHGKSLAARLGKKIEFEISSEVENVSPQVLKTIFDILLHLVRNAIDHGIERDGKIKIEAASNAGGVSLKVSDDGRGIDLEKVRRRAVEKNLISADADLSEAAILNLIFAHGFSTSENVSEISGRGVGLDVVKDLTEKSGGAISVRSESGQGTTFEILLKEN